MAANWSKFIVAGGLLAGGVVTLWVGLKPTKADYVAETWRPPRVELSSQQQRDIDAALKALNELREAIRLAWSNGTWSKPTGTAYKLSPKIVAEALANANYPWRRLDAGWAQVHLADYSTHIVSMGLQNNVALCDVLFVEAGLAGFPAQVSSSALVSQINAVLRNPGALSLVAGCAALASGTLIHARFATNFEAAQAREFAVALQNNMPGPDLTKPALAWLALHTGMGGLASAERQTARALAASNARTPRNLVV